MFWVLSDSTLFLTVGSDQGEHAFRVPYETIAEIRLDLRRDRRFPSPYVRISVDVDNSGPITKLEPGSAPGQHLGAPPPIIVDGSDRAYLAEHG
jgi:hypothetical protein